MYYYYYYAAFLSRHFSHKSSNSCMQPILNHIHVVCANSQASITKSQPLIIVKLLIKKLILGLFLSVNHVDAMHFESHESLMLNGCSVLPR